MIPVDFDDVERDGKEEVEKEDEEREVGVTVAAEDEGSAGGFALTTDER